MCLRSPCEPTRTVQFGWAIWTCASRPARLGAILLSLALVSRLRWDLAWCLQSGWAKDSTIWGLIKISVQPLMHLHRPTPPLTCIHYTLSVGPANDRQAAQHYSPPQLIPPPVGLAHWAYSTLIRPQHWGRYIGLADATPSPHKAKQGPPRGIVIRRVCWLVNWLVGWLVHYVRLLAHGRLVGGWKLNRVTSFQC